MQSLRSPAKRAVDRLLTNGPAARLALRTGGLRRRRIVLVWHRVRPHPPAPWEIVRTVPTERFAAQLDVVLELGDVVSLSDVEADGHPGPCFALTFDDDDPGHVEWVLPELERRKLPATFFLSGRWRTQAGPYWWQVLEARIRSEGAASVAASYGLPPDTPPEEMGRLLTGTPEAARLDGHTAAPAGETMQLGHAAMLVGAGMEVGFHTHDHQLLRGRSQDAVRTAATDGRDELAHQLHTTISRFAYPHGRADARAADAVREAGYRSAWTTTKRTVSDDDDPMLRGRWALEQLDPEAFRSALLRAMIRPGP